MKNEKKKKKKKKVERCVSIWCVVACRSRTRGNKDAGSTALRTHKYAQESGRSIESDRKRDRSGRFRVGSAVAVCRVQGSSCSSVIAL